MTAALMLMIASVFAFTDCNTNGIDDAVDTMDIALPAPPSQFLTYVNAASSSDIRATTRLDDFVLTSNTRLTAVEVEGRGGGADKFLLRIWDAYSLTDANTDGVADPGTFHPRAVRYQETLSSGRITYTAGPLAGAPNGSIGRWRLRLSGDVVLPGAATGTTYFLEVVYVGSAATPWTWERISPMIGSSLHAGAIDRGQEFIFVSSTPGAGLRFRLWTCTATDINGNSVLDVCEDCDSNGTPDAAESSATDCNTNGRPDTCDVMMPLVIDCNSNVVPDECESADCNTNGTNDVCDIASGVHADCNTNAIPDGCELDGLSATAVTQMEGMSEGPTSFHGFSANATTFARADDFVLSRTTTIGGLALAGYFNVAPTGANHQFTIRFRGENGALPGASIIGTVIDGAALTNATYQPLMFGASQTIRVFRLRMNTPITLPPGSYWIESYYSGTPTSYVWNWGLLEPQAHHLTARSPNTAAESWVTIDNKVRYLMNLYHGASDCNTNGLIDVCESTGGDANQDGVPDVCQCPHCIGDINGDNRVDGMDIAGWVRCTLESPQAGDHCGCGIAWTLPQFVSRLLDTNGTNCP